MLNIVHIITPHASCGAVYCNRSCLFVAGCVCGGVGGSVTTITLNCVHQSSPNSVGESSDHLQLIKFWPSRSPGKGSEVGQIFGSALLQPVCSVASL